MHAGGLTWREHYKGTLSTFRGPFLAARSPWLGPLDRVWTIARHRGGRQGVTGGQRARGTGGPGYLPPAGAQTGTVPPRGGSRSTVGQAAGPGGGRRRLGGQAERPEEPPHRMRLGDRAENPPRPRTARTDEDLDR